MTENQKKIGIGVVAGIICLVAFYFFYWVKTPTYSLNIIKEAVQKHDVTTFERHVDMDTLYTKAFDDFIVATDKIEGKNSLANPLAAGFIQMFKAPVVAALKAATIEGIKGEDKNATAKKDDAANMANNIKGRSGLDKAVFKDVSVISTEGDTALVAIKLHNRKVDKDFSLKVKMTKLDDGKWKLKEVANLVEFMVEVDNAEKLKLAELDKPIKEEIYKCVQMDGIRGGWRNEGRYFANWVAESGLKLKNISGKDIKNIKGHIHWVKSSDKSVVKVTPLLETGAVKAGGTGELYTKMHLNEFSDEDKPIIQAKDKELSLNVKVMSIEFEDGKTLVRPTSLPDPDAPKK